MVDRKRQEKQERRYMAAQGMWRDGKEWYAGQVEVKLKRMAVEKVGGLLTMKLSDLTNGLSFPLKKDVKSLLRRKGSPRFRGA